MTEPTSYSTPAAPVGAPTNTLAIISLVAAFIIAPLGIILGFIARGQIKQTGESGAGLAKAGIIVGFVITILYILGIVLGIVIPLLILGAAGYSY